jgi:hypothetical protein
MSDLLPQVIPVDEIKTTTSHVTSDDGDLKEAINTATEPQAEQVDAFEGDDDIIREEIKEELDKEEEAEPPLPPKEIQEDEDVFKDAKPKKKKRQISESQREHLAQARKKALEVRRRKAQEKKILQQQERRAKAKAKKEAKNMTAPHNPMESESEDEAPAPVKVKTIKSHAFDEIDEDLLVRVQEAAIEKYEVKRKARKQKKQQEQDEKQKEADIHRVVAKAVKPQDPDDMWSVCFA